MVRKGVPKGASWPSPILCTSLSDTVFGCRSVADQITLKGELVDDATVDEALAKFDNLWQALVPREQARLMPLAIRCEQLIRDGIIANQSAFADFGHITTARTTQIMTLLNLAPDIQEQVLFLSRTQRGRDAISEMDVRPIAATLDWCKQWRMWMTVCGGTSSRPEGAST